MTRTQRERRIALSEAAPWRSKGMDCVFSVYFERRKAQKMSNQCKAQKARKPRINKGKTRISAGFSLAEMEGFEPSRHFRTLLP